MKNLYNALMLKKLLIEKELGVKYIEPIKEFKEEQVNLPNSIDELRAITLNCHLCELSKTRQNIVFGEGNRDAELMFVGEGPGANEDATGKPFVGRAGELLTKMIENVLHLPRQSVYIANIVKCRPAQNRVPTSIELGKVTCSSLNSFIGSMYLIPNSFSISSFFNINALYKFFIISL